MKFALNGALTIGTEDGANIEIRDNVGADNIFIFGRTTQQVAELQPRRLRAVGPLRRRPAAGGALDAIGRGDFSPDEPHRYRGLVDGLLNGDHYKLLADYGDYVAAQHRVDALYRDADAWTRHAIANVAGMGAVLVRPHDPAVRGRSLARRSAGRDRSAAAAMKAPAGGTGAGGEPEARADGDGSPPLEAGAVLEAGRPWPLGAHFDGDGVNFAVFSAHAEAIELCLFDDRGEVELQRLALPARTDDVRHGYLRGAAPGLVYGLRAHGPWLPVQGHRFNPHKLLLDPHAREIVGRFEWRREHFGSARDDVRIMDRRDNAAWALKARVVADGEGGASAGPRPHTPLADTVLYEAHVKGLTQRHPGVPEKLRGTYAGLASEAMVGASAQARRHDGQPAAGACTISTRNGSARSASSTTGATTRSASSRPRRAMRRARRPATTPCATSSAPWRDACTRAAWRW